MTKEKPSGFRPAKCSSCGHPNKFRRANCSYCSRKLPVWNNLEFWIILAILLVVVYVLI